MQARVEIVSQAGLEQLKESDADSHLTNIPAFAPALLKQTYLDIRGRFLSFKASATAAQTRSLNLNTLLQQQRSQEGRGVDDKEDADAAITCFFTLYPRLFENACSDPPPIPQSLVFQLIDNSYSNSQQSEKRAAESNEQLIQAHFRPGKPPPQRQGQGNVDRDDGISRKSQEQNQ